MDRKTPARRVHDRAGIAMPRTEPPFSRPVEGSPRGTDEPPILIQLTVSAPRNWSSDQQVAGQRHAWARG